METTDKLSRSFHNTINLGFHELKEQVLNAKGMEQQIKVMFKGRPSEELTPPEVLWKLRKITNRDFLLTSVRRAMSNLTHEGVLVKTDKRKDGPYGMKNFCWRLNKGQ